jgi:hypothetical protein
MGNCTKLSHLGGAAAAVNEDGSSEENESGVCAERSGIQVP